jgi:predicted nucleic acid-binding protein
MPTEGRAPELLVDTSVAVALSVADHQQHEAVSRSLRGRSLGLAGHAAFETFSVLTRLPPPARRSPATIGRLLGMSFPHSRYLGARAATSLLDELGRLGIAGGAVYDALVGACANEHERPLATADRRALETYRALNVRVEWLG